MFYHTHFHVDYYSKSEFDNLINSKISKSSTANPGDLAVFRFYGDVYGKKLITDVDLDGGTF